jgi:hypothetical protein
VYNDEHISSARTHPEDVMILSQDIRFAVPEALVDALQNLEAGVVPGLALVNALITAQFENVMKSKWNMLNLVGCQVTRNECKSCVVDLKCHRNASLSI